MGLLVVARVQAVPLAANRCHGSESDPNVMSSPKSAQLQADIELQSGLSQTQSSLPTMLLNGQTASAANSLAVVQSRVDAGNALVSAKAALAQASQAYKDTIANTKVFVSALRTALATAYGSSPETLAKYGLVPRKKPAPLTVEEKMVAVARRASTRVVRHTTGPVARAKVKGAVPSTITVQVPGPEAPEPASPGAPAGSPAAPPAVQGK